MPFYILISNLLSKTPSIIVLYITEMSASVPYQSTNHSDKGCFICCASSCYFALYGNLTGSRDILSLSLTPAW